MIREPQRLFAGMWASIRESVISALFPPDLLQPIEKALQYIPAKLEENIALRPEILLKQTMLKPITEPKDHYQRLYLRNLVGLPPIPKTETASVEDLKGCISWISTSKIDVTELIREIRDS
jgi:hypothetical protein